jgi:hypothetical protein
MCLSRCECGECLVIAMGTMQLVCPGCGYPDTQPITKYPEIKNEVEQSVREVNKTLPERR